MKKDVKEQIIELAKQYCGHERNMEKVRKRLYRLAEKSTFKELCSLWDNGLCEVIQEHYIKLCGRSDRNAAGRFLWQKRTQGWRAYFVSKAVDFDVAERKCRKRSTKSDPIIGEREPGTIGPWRIFKDGELDLDQVEIAMASLKSLVTQEQFDKVMQRVKRIEPRKEPMLKLAG